MIIRKQCKIIGSKAESKDVMSLVAEIFTKDSEPDADYDTYDKDIIVQSEDPLRTLFMHDRYQKPFGKVNKVNDQDDQVTVEASILRRMTDGNDIAIAIEEELLDSVSMGFKANKYEVIENEDYGWWGFGRNYKDITLTEISIVDVPAVPTARILEAKHLRTDDFDTELLKSLPLSLRKAIWAHKNDNPEFNINELLQTLERFRTDLT